MSRTTKRHRRKTEYLANGSKKHGRMFQVARPMPQHGGSWKEPLYEVEYLTIQAPHPADACAHADLLQHLRKVELWGHKPRVNMGLA